VAQPAPAPRFSATPAADPDPPEVVGSSTQQVLAELGLSDGEIAGLRENRVVA